MPNTTAANTTCNTSGHHGLHARSLACTGPIVLTDDALDAATKGRKGTARPGFHLAFRAERFTTANGLPGRRNVAERCTCTHKGNHAA